jgi:GT2 family glycosyltransferase
VASGASSVAPRVDLALVPPLSLVEPRVSVVLVSFNSGGALLRCLATIDHDDECVDEIVIVNNGLDGEELEIAARSLRVRLLSPGRNIGFGAGCNLGADAATGDVLVFLNPDTVAMPGAVAELVRTLDDDSIGIAMARVRLLQEPELLNSCGNVIHISGLGWSEGYGDPAGAPGVTRDVASPSGAAMAIRREDFEHAGGFRGELFLYHEDQDLGWRMRMLGRRIVMNPRADILHEHDFDRHDRKRYYLERNRLAFLLLDFSLRTLVVLLPVLVATELSMLLLSARQGWLREKLAGSLWFVRNAPRLLGLRRETQRLRVVPDRELVTALTPVIDTAEIPVPEVVRRVVNPLLAGYWSLARRVI